MAKSKGVRLTNEQIDAADDMTERGEADNSSEALRMFINAGMQSYGYQAGQRHETALKLFTYRLAWALGLVGIVWMATTLWLPVALRTPAVVAFSASIGTFGVYRVLDRWEPRVTERMRALFGGESA